jgi:hypothetical protein
VTTLRNQTIQTSSELKFSFRVRITVVRRTITRSRSQAFSEWCTSCTTSWRASIGRCRCISPRTTANSFNSHFVGSIGNKSLLFVCLCRTDARVLTMALRISRSASLLIRELSLSHIVRMWDSYLSEGEGETGGFASFHVYVCCAFLCRFSRELRQLDFQEIMLFLQRLPTELWVEQDIELLLSQGNASFCSGLYVCDVKLHLFLFSLFICSQIAYMWHQLRRIVCVPLRSSLIFSRSISQIVRGRSRPLTIAFNCRQLLLNKCIISNLRFNRHPPSHTI